MNDVMIHTSNLAKRYQRYRKGEGIRNSIASLWKRDYEEKTAVVWKQGLKHYHSASS